MVMKMPHIANRYSAVDAAASTAATAASAATSIAASAENIANGSYFLPYGSFILDFFPSLSFLSSLLSFVCLAFSPFIFFPSFLRFSFLSSLQVVVRTCDGVGKWPRECKRHGGRRKVCLRKGRDSVVLLFAPPHYRALPRTATH
jgi:hypothetical protein